MILRGPIQIGAVYDSMTALNVAVARCCCYLCLCPWSGVGTKAGNGSSSTRRSDLKTQISGAERARGQGRTMVGWSDSGAGLQMGGFGKFARNILD